MNRLRRRFQTEEEGAALIICLAFLTFAFLIVGALLNMSYTSLRATSKLKIVRNTDYDADAAMEQAIATIRVDPARGYFNACPSIDVPALNNVGSGMRVDCTALLKPVFQREVILSVCPASEKTKPCPDDKSLLQARVSYYDDKTFGRAALVQTWSANR